jgi:hypothetical protein
MFESTCVCPAAWIEVGDELLESDEWSSELQAPSSNPKAARVATWRGFLIMSKIIMVVMFLSFLLPSPGIGFKSD